VVVGEGGGWYECVRPRMRGCARGLAQTMVLVSGQEPLEGIRTILARRKRQGCVKKRLIHHIPIRALSNNLLLA